MKQRFRLYRRGNSRRYYIHDDMTGKQESLHTSDRPTASGVTLHCYRYAWAERAKAAGYPERFAMQNLGHGSEAAHRAYSKKAPVKLPPLEEYESKIVPLEIPKAPNTQNVQSIQVS